MGAPLVISYTRFSSAGQADGDSERRQVELAERYAAKHGLTINEDLQFTDRAKSGYTGENLHKGALGELLKLVRAGKVPKGSILLIENFDRLSRAIPLDALTLFTEIINAGLTIVTLHDEQKFNREALERNPYLLFGVFMEQVRANSESAAKSKRIREVWDQKKKAAKADGKVMTRKTPYWLRSNKDRTGFELISERAEVVRWLIDQSERGVGNNTLIKLLHERGVAPWSKSGSWQPSYMQKMLRSPALFGGIRLDGEIVKGYYPPLIDEDRFYRLQAQRADRKTTQATSCRGKLLSNLFSQRLVCGYCGFAIAISGYKENPTDSRKGYERKYVGCHGARIRDPKGCEKPTVWFMDELEPLLLNRIGALNPRQLVGDDGTKLDAEKQTLATLTGRLADAVRKAKNIAVALEEAPSKTLSQSLQRLEAEQDDLQVKISEQTTLVDALAARQGSGRHRAETMVKLFKLMKDAKTEVELKAIRQQLADIISKVVERVVLYPAGPKYRGSKLDRYAIVTLHTGEVVEIDDTDDMDESVRVDKVDLATMLAEEV